MKANHRRHYMRYMEDHDEEIKKELEQQEKEEYGQIANANLVNIRERPDINSKILRIAKNGEKFKITSGNERGFYGVEHQPGKAGYIHANYFKPI